MSSLLQYNMQWSHLPLPCLSREVGPRTDKRGDSIKTSWGIKETLTLSETYIKSKAQAKQLRAEEPLTSRQNHIRKAIASSSSLPWISTEPCLPQVPKTPLLAPKELYKDEQRHSEPDVLWISCQHQHSRPFGCSLHRLPPLLFYHNCLNYQDEIRLVKIVAGPPSSMVRCRLVHTRLNALTTPYTALSYVWGCTNYSISVECADNGASIYVTENCYSALRRLRRESEDTLVWIDAMAINQQHPDERNHQVRAMKRIYSKAESVIACLGEGDENIMQLLKRIERRSSAEILPSSHSAPELQLLNEFLTLPYFHRIWILQEVYFARRLEIIYGCISLDGALFRNITSIYSALGDHFLSSNLPLTVNIRNSGSAPSLWSLLCSTRTYQASDPRDRVIALLGMAHDIDDVARRHLINYGLTLHEIWQRVVVFFFLRAIGIHLHASGASSHPSSSQDSWESILDLSWFPDLDISNCRNIHFLDFCDPVTSLATSQYTLGNSCTQNAIEQVTLLSDPCSVEELSRLWALSHAILDPALTKVDSMKALNSLHIIQDNSNSFNKNYSIRLAISSKARIYLVTATSIISERLCPLPHQQIALEYSCPYLSRPNLAYLGPWMVRGKRQLRRSCCAKHNARDRFGRTGL